MSQIPLQSDGVTSLQWVLVDDQLHHVSEYAHLPSKERPLALCPVCREAVRMKLGEVLVHHCAHMPGSTCVASVGETAIHLNTKLHIYSQLLKTDKLSISRKCVTCSNTHETVWVRNWDDIHIEYSIGSRRPDIALLSEGKVIGAIEVFVSHAIDLEKADFFKSQQIRWIEIKGLPSIYFGSDQWMPPKSLSVRQIGPDVKEWTCEACYAKLPKNVDERNELRRKQLQKENKKYWKERDKEISEEYERNNGSKVYCGRFMDFFYPNQTWKRKNIVVIKKLVNKECVSMRIEVFNQEVLVEVEGGDEKSQIELNQKFKQYREALSKSGVITDSPMNWMNNQQFIHLLCREEPRFVWNDDKKIWVLPRIKLDHKWKFFHV